jgi:hypothetical protein
MAADLTFKNAVLIVEFDCDHQFESVSGFDTAVMQRGSPGLTAFDVVG